MILGFHFYVKVHLIYNLVLPWAYWDLGCKIIQTISRVMPTQLEVLS